MSTSPEKVRDQLFNAGLGRVAEQLVSAVPPALRLKVEPAKEMLALGRSKIGGRPDLPAPFQWPRCNGVPLSFLAQIDLAEARSFWRCNGLPQAGRLLFFYDVKRQPWGFDPMTAGVLRFDRYCDVLDELDATEGQGMLHQLLGHPSPIQDEMQLQCQLASNGIDVGGPEGYEDPRRSELEPGALSWRLLFQLDSGEACGMMWGDLGRLYFWTQDDDLEKVRFDRAWVILQCS